MASSTTRANQTVAEMVRNSRAFSHVLLCLKNNYNDDITRWKLVRAFESFNDIKVIKILMDIEQNDSQPIIRNEA